jgi:hypothetical protein
MIHLIQNAAVAIKAEALEENAVSRANSVHARVLRQARYNPLIFTICARKRRACREPGFLKRGKSKSALPPTSDVDLYGEIVVDLKCSGSQNSAVRHRIFLWSTAAVLLAAYRPASG